MYQQNVKTNLERKNENPAANGPSKWRETLPRQRPMRHVRKYVNLNIQRSTRVYTRSRGVTFCDKLASGSRHV